MTEAEKPETAQMRLQDLRTLIDELRSGERQMGEAYTLEILNQIVLYLAEKEAEDGLHKELRRRSS